MENTNEGLKVVPADKQEKFLFYNNSDIDDGELGCVGHVRGDFGTGNEFWHTWWPWGNDERNTPQFKKELTETVDAMRDGGLLKDRHTMLDLCREMQAARIDRAWHRDVFGFKTESEHYRFYIRCFPHPGDYNFTIYCYEKNRLDAWMQRRKPG